MLQKSYGMHVFSFFFGHITERMYSDAMFYVENEKSARMRRKHCALAVVRRSQKFRPAADPLPAGAGRPKFNQLEVVSIFTHKPSLVRIDARSFELLW